MTEPVVERFPTSGRVLVGLSGGVDSSVAAALLLDRGLEVVGVSLHLWEYGQGRAHASRCCAPEDIADAARTCDALGIAHFTFDRTRGFRDQVVDPFVTSYLEGRTPSPCVTCNREVKIGSFVELTEQLGAVGFATGHYARVGEIGGTPALYRGVDGAKDQSYFLFGIGHSALSKLVAPLGALTKDQVREVARKRGLPNADKPDSEDLCFVEGDHLGFVEREAAGRIRPGPIVDGDGRVLGQHQGVHRFTVGQRKGLGVAVGKPQFVSEIDRDTATVRLGDADTIVSHVAIVHDVAKLTELPNRPLLARIRSRHEGTFANVTEQPDGTLHVAFHEAARAVTPGQVCVLYDGDRVIAGGTISRAVAETNSA